MPVKKNIDALLAIIVLYQTPLEQALTIQSLSKNLKLLNQKLDLFVYDNSPIPLYQQSNFTYKLFRVHYISDIKNSGISIA